MKAIKNINIVYVLLLVSAIVLAVLAIFYRMNERPNEAKITGGFAIGLAAAVIILRLQVKFFPDSFNNKPSREDFEKNVTNKKEPNDIH